MQRTVTVARQLGATVLGGMVAVWVLAACEEPPAVPKAAATPAQPAPAPRSSCVPNVAIHGTATGGTIQGAIKDSVLYWAGARSNVECLRESQQRLEQRVGGDDTGGSFAYRVIRVHEAAGERYYMLKYVDGAPVCIINEEGNCTRKLSSLGDLDVDTLPASAPTLGGSETPPTPPDSAPSFRAESAANQTYTTGTAIDHLTLPEATGGDGTLAYSLAPDVPGLTFVPVARLLIGTPTAAGTYAMTYRVIDADANTSANDAATLAFTITVVAPPPQPAPPPATARWTKVTPLVRHPCAVRGGLSRDPMCDPHDDYVELAELGPAAWGNGRFVVGACPAASPFCGVITSTDGITWSFSDVDFSHSMTVAWNGTRFVGSNADGDSRIMHSTDGITWTKGTRGSCYPYSVEPISIRHGAGWWAITTGSQVSSENADGTYTYSIAYRSTDGITWTCDTDTPQIPEYYYLGWDKGEYVAGITRLPDFGRPRRFPADYPHVAWNGKRFVASDARWSGKRNDDVAYTVYSPDGATWFAASVPDGSYTYGVTWTGKRFVSIGHTAEYRQRHILHSTDGITWHKAIPVDADADVCERCIASNGDRTIFVVRSADRPRRPFILLSPEGW